MFRRLGCIFQQTFVACNPESLPLQGVEVHIGSPCNVIGFGNTAFVKNLIPDPRENEILFDYRILPRDIPLGNSGIMIVVPIDKYFIIQRIIIQDEAHVVQRTEFVCIRRKKTHIKMGGFNRVP